MAEGKNPDDLERYVLALTALRARYAEVSGALSTSAHGQLMRILFDDVLEWLRSGQRSGEQKRRSRSDLEDNITLRKGGVFGENYLRKLVPRIEASIAALARRNETFHGVRIALTGPTHPGFPELWLEAAFEDDDALPRATLPPLPITFIGRDEFVARLRLRLTHVHRGILGLHGEPYIGKTAVAIALAEVLGREAPEKPRFIEIAATSGQASDEIAVLLRVLGRSAIGAKKDLVELRRRFRIALDAAPCIIVFDDLDCADAFAQIVPPVGSVFILTSRQKLPIATVDWIQVPPLSVVAGTRLVAALAKHHKSPLPKVREALEAVVEVCGGNPGALTTATAALASASISELEGLTSELDMGRAPWFDRRFLSGVEFPLATSRRRTDRALTEAEVWAYRRLSIFEGRFDSDVVLLFDTAVLERRGLLQYDRTTGTYSVPVVVRWHALASMKPEQWMEAQRSRAEYYEYSALNALTKNSVALSRDRAIDRLTCNPTDFLDTLAHLASFAEGGDQKTAEQYVVLCRFVLTNRPELGVSANAIEDQIALLGRYHRHMPHVGVAIGQFFTARSGKRVDLIEQALALAPEERLLRQVALKTIVDIERDRPERCGMAIARALEKSGSAEATSYPLDELLESAMLYVLLGERRCAERTLQTAAQLRRRLKTTQNVELRIKHQLVCAGIALLGGGAKHALKHLRRAARLLRSRRDERLSLTYGLAAVASRHTDSTDRLHALVDQAMKWGAESPGVRVTCGYALFRRGEYSTAEALLSHEQRCEPLSDNAEEELWRALLPLARAIARAETGYCLEALRDARAAEALLTRHQSRFRHLAKRLSREIMNAAAGEARRQSR